MCLLAILYRVVDDAPLILAANREEDYARGGTNLDLRSGPLSFVAGLDPVAGGTWMGINSAKLVVAVTNRNKCATFKNARSRGLLVKDLLGLSSAREAAQTAARELSAREYAGCNIVCADMDSLWVIHAGDWLRVRSLAPGYHVMTNADMNDAVDDRLYWVLEQLHAAGPADADQALDVLQRVASHNGGPAPISFRKEERGTVASTLLALSPRRRQSRMLHANGAPHRVPYVDRTDLLWELEALAEKERR